MSHSNPRHVSSSGQLKAKEERRRKRLAKALRKMEKKERLPKPLIECEVPIQLHKERAERVRTVALSPEEEEARVLHMKDWARYLYSRNHNEIWEQDRILLSQQAALEELKKESVALYDAAIQFDPDLIPLSFKGPVSSPPIKNYIQVGHSLQCQVDQQRISTNFRLFRTENIKRQHPHSR